jgi:CheY-like chemotaxis protein/HPt (histidine-containing phosphotransfer) domain-containing protein
MGGDIEVESKKGEGTTVTIKLTCKKGTVSDIPARDTTIADTKILEGKRILVTDDNDMNRLVAATVLNNYGATIIEAANGQEAVDILSTEEVDLVLMDIQMPVLDGLEATQIIRNQLHSKIPVIALTANAIRGENEKCLNAGMNDYISKPFKEEDFVSTIARWLGKEITMISAAEQNNTGSPLFKLDQLYNISRGNDAFVKKMIDLFIQQTPVAVQDIKEAYTVNDFTKVKALAHKMKPSIDNLEISLLTSDIRLIESLVLQGKRSDELDILINKLEEVIDKVVSEIKLI